MDGHPFSPCFWPTHYVNLNGKTYQWEHENQMAGEWKEQAANVHIPNLNLIAEFPELPLKEFDYALKRHPAHLISDYERLNVMNEIMGITRETQENALPGITISEKQDNKFSQMYSWTDYLKILVFATIGFVVFIIVAYIFARINPIPALIDSFRTKRNNKQDKRDLETADVPLEQFQPMLPSAPQPIIIPGNAYPYIVRPSTSTSISNFLNRMHL